jgi:hypothetical protein
MTATSAPRAAHFLAILVLLWTGSLAPALAATHPGQAELVREVARDTGKSPQALNALLDGAKMQQSILDAISRPAEGKPWKDYRPIFLTDKRIDDGIAFYREHRALLEQIGRQYGVAPQYIVAIVGVETSYGHNTGKYKVLDALVTLGLYYPPRAKFFREQLKELLEMPDNHLAGPVDTLTGSYAGAQGWGQFMPSSIRDFGVDADGDGHIDMKNSLPTLRELQDAAVTLLGQGDPAVVRESLLRVEVGTAIGALAKGVSQTSIQDDFYRELSRLKLDQFKASVKRELDLDCARTGASKRRRRRFLICTVPAFYIGSPCWKWASASS